MLQGRDELERVQRHHTVVVVGREQQRGRILDAVSDRHCDIVQRRVLHQVLEVLLLVRAAVVGDPRKADRELVEAQHVENAEGTQSHSIQFEIILF